MIKFQDIYMIGTEIVGLECQRQATFEISKQIISL